MGSLVDGNYVNTIKPAGGGDFTSLQSWEDSIDDDAGGDPQSLGHAGYHAECYKGGDLGSLQLNVWGSPATAERHPKIYVAAGQGHGGDKTDGAYISTSSGVVSNNAIWILAKYSEIIGLRVETTSSSYTGISATDGGTDGCYISHCLLHGPANKLVTAGQILSTNADTSTTKLFVIRNNMLIPETLSPFGTGAYGMIIGGGANNSSVQYVYAQNNTIISNSSADWAGQSGALGGIGIIYSAFNVLYLYMENNYSSTSEDTGLSSPSHDYAFLSYGGTYNDESVSNNSQAASTGGIASTTNAGTSKARADSVNNHSSYDYSLTDSSSLKDTGMTPSQPAASWIPSLDDDITSRSRPVNSSYDRGCFEYPTSAPAPAAKTIDWDSDSNIGDDGDLSSSDVYFEPKPSRLRRQGAVCVSSGGVNFGSKGHKIKVPAQAAINRMSNKIKKDKRQNQDDSQGGGV